MAISIEDNPQQRRVEIRVDGELAGAVIYRRRPGRIVFRHTEIDDAYEGQGLGSQLARAALDQARDRGDQVVAVCPFISRFIREHPEYADLT